MITRIENLQHLMPLQRLNLSMNRIIRLENLTCQSELREFNISHNLIETLEGLDQLSQLTTLNISPIPLHPLGFNKIVDIREIQKLRANRGLKSLVVEGNPLCDTE